MAYNQALVFFYCKIHDQGLAGFKNHLTFAAPFRKTEWKQFLKTLKFFFENTRSEKRNRFIFAAPFKTTGRS